MVSLKALVTFDYQPEAQDELGLKVGDIITGVEQVEEGWCRGSLNGKIGMFPDNFVKIIEEKPKAVAAPAKQKKKVLRKVKVTFPYNPVNEDELKLETGDVIEVLHDEEEGWATGLLRDKKGVFPTNFTEEVTPKQQQPDTAPAPAPAPSSQPPNEGEIHKIEKPPKVEEPPVQSVQPKKVKGIGFGNIFGEGPIKLRSSASGTTVNKEDKNVPVKEKSITPVQSDAKPVTPVPIGVHLPPKKTSKPPVERCIVMFDYAAETNDELTLTKDDVIVIIEKNSGDDGWWEGEITDENGKKTRGVFPDNFVKVLPPETESTAEKVVKEKEQIDTKPKQKIKPPESDDSFKVKALPSLLKGNSLKRVAPQTPLVVSNNKTEHKDGADFSELNNTSDTQLKHYKRAGGPPNRRKPNAAGRRERAKEITDEKEKMPEVKSDPENDQAESMAEPQVTPKRENTTPKGARGIQVMPTAKTTPDGTQGDAPSWLKNLRTRNSVKKPTDATLSAAVTLPTKEETPNWMVGLKKPKPGSQKPKPASNSPVSPKPVTPPVKPSQPATKPTNVPKPVVTTPTPVPATNHSAPPPHPAPPSADKIAEAHEKSGWIKTGKSKSENNILASEKRSSENHSENSSKVAVAVEAKKPMKPPTAALQPPKMPPAARPKPPTLKSKPQLPSSKPVSGGAVEELKEEMKSLKEMIASMQAEHKKELASLQHELSEEKKNRELLEIVVSEMGKQIGSLS